jgi:hypothetical protein
MKYIFFMMSLLLSGCFIIVDDECHRHDPYYSHTEYDCYYASERVQVCNRDYCWHETRDRRVCDEYDVCYDRNW